MPDYRRWRVPGGTHFLTINLLERRSDLLVRHIDALREAVRRARRERPFRIDAWVVLPEDLHCIITLPAGSPRRAERAKRFRHPPLTALAPADFAGRGADRLGHVWRSMSPRRAEPWTGSATHHE